MDVIVPPSRNFDTSTTITSLMRSVISITPSRSSCSPWAANPRGTQPPSRPRCMPAMQYRRRFARHMPESCLSAGLEGMSEFLGVCRASAHHRAVSWPPSARAMAVASFSMELESACSESRGGVAVWREEAHEAGDLGVPIGVCAQLQGTGSRHVVACLMPLRAGSEVAIDGLNRSRLAWPSRDAYRQSDRLKCGWTVAAPETRYHPDGAGCATRGVSSVVLIP
jgi:hypothetical protein